MLQQNFHLHNNILELQMCFIVNQEFAVEAQKFPASKVCGIR